MPQEYEVTEKQSRTQNYGDTRNRKSDLHYHAYTDKKKDALSVTSLNDFLFCITVEIVLQV